MEKLTSLAVPHAAAGSSSPAAARAPSPLRRAPTTPIDANGRPYSTHVPSVSSDGLVGVAVGFVAAAAERIMHPVAVPHATTPSIALSSSSSSSKDHSTRGRPTTPSASPYGGLSPPMVPAPIARSPQLKAAMSSDAVAFPTLVVDQPTLRVGTHGEHLTTPISDTEYAARVRADTAKNHEHPVTVLGALDGALRVQEMAERSRSKSPVPTHRGE
ncbi:hypothetical protein BC828DRAFT_378581 [Blastocladiella britannica]|nr:hypothetical protein BC828DRAFT_378581 [Blastocladiella britannica]